MSIRPHGNLCMLCITCFLMFKHWFCWKYQYTNIHVYLISSPFTLYSCEYSCVSRTPLHCFARGPIILLRRPCPLCRNNQLIWYFRAWGSYHVFLDRGLLHTRKLLNQGFLVVTVRSSIRRNYGRHHDLGNIYWISAPQMTTDMVFWT